MSYINLCPISVILVYVLHSYPMSVGYISQCLTLIYVLYQLVILVYVLHSFMSYVSWLY